MTNYAPSLRLAAAAELELRRRHRPRLWHGTARPSQRTPPGYWRIWLILAGRGWGKSKTIVEFANEQAEAMPGSFGAVVGATAADTRDILVTGPSGFEASENPPTYEASKRRLTWPNGSTALLFSAEEPNRLRGPQFHWAIADELAAWKRPEAFDMLLMGLRLGANPRVAVATTPRPTKAIKGLMTDLTCHVTRGSTYENRANLAPQFFEQIIRRYEGTRLGRQELDAEILDDVEGALWSYGLIDAHRTSDPPPMKRIVVGVDPKASTEADSETGIIVAGLGANGHGYILGDRSLDASPEQWGRAVAAAYHDHDADRIVPEVNQGGDMVVSVLRTVDRTLPIRPVRASRGKQTRAEPIAALYEQGRVHHVGSFPALEDQLCSWTAGDKSPDRLDALVHALTDLMLTQTAQRPRVREY